MASASIEINGSANSADFLPLNTPVQLSNDDTGGEVSYLWELLDIPEGSIASLTNPAIENPLFTPDVEGTYLVRLTVNAALTTEVIDRKIAAVRYTKSWERAPAAGEIVELDIRGWARAMNQNLRRFEANLVDANIVFALAGSTDVGIGSIVALRGSVGTIRAGLPYEETVLVAEAAFANDANLLAGKLGVVIGTPSGSGVAEDEPVLVRMFGLSEIAGNQAGVALGDLVFVASDASFSLDPGDFWRPVGHVVHVDGDDYRWIIDNRYGIAPRVTSALEAMLTNGSGTWAFYGAEAGETYAGWVSTDSAATGLAYPLKVGQGEKLWKIEADVLQTTGASQVQARIQRGNGNTGGGVQSDLVTSPALAGAQKWTIDTTTGLVLPFPLVYGDSLWLYITSTGANTVARSIGNVTAFVTPAG